MQPEAPVKSVPVNYSVEWLKCSVKISEKNYTLFLKVGLFTTLTTIAVALVPYIGVAVAPVLGFIYALAMLRFTKLIIDRQPITFEGFLNLAFDQDILKRFRPYLIIVFVCGVVEVILALVHMKFLVLPFSLLAGILISACSFAAYTEIKLNTNNPNATLQFILKGYLANILPLLATIILTMMAAAVCAVFCIVPLFVVFIPLAVPLRYLIYSAIYENRDILSTTSDWTSAPKVPVITEAPSI